MFLRTTLFGFALAAVAGTTAFAQEAPATPSPASASDQMSGHSMSSDHMSGHNMKSDHNMVSDHMMSGHSMQSDHMMTDHPAAAPNPTPGTNANPTSGNPFYPGVP